MRLIVEDSCNNCNNCLKDCPEKLTKTCSIKCMHCNPKEAKCLEACKTEAIYEVAEGILSIDKKLCNGCKKCFDACQYGAIEIIDQKASKCNLCAENNFVIKCIAACSFGLIKKEKDEKEKELVENIIGWGLIKEEGRVLVENKNYKLVKKGNELFYYLKLPLISKQEAILIKKCREVLLEDKTNRNTKEFLIDYCKNNNIILDEEQKEYISSIIEMLSTGIGPLTKLLEDDDIEEISLAWNKNRNILYVYKKNIGWMKTNLYYSKPQDAINTINAMAREIGRRITLQNPILNATLADGSRLNASIDPVAFNGPSFTVRKFRKKPYLPNELINNNTISAEAMAFIWLAALSECSIMICGNTGSGKTTTLNSIFYLIPKEERIIIVEETPEINIPHEHKIKLCCNEELGINMEKLICETLRMRPDRIIVGEIRTKEEIRAFIDTLLAGQGRGSYATFHAQSAKEAILRIKNKGIEEIDITALDLIIVQRRWAERKDIEKEIRRVVEIVEILNDDKKILSTNKLYEYSYEKDDLVKKSRSRRVLEKIKNCFGWNEKQINEKIDKIAKKLKNNFLGFEQENPLKELIYDDIN